VRVNDDEPRETWTYCCHLGIQTSLQSGVVILYSETRLRRRKSSSDGGRKRDVGQEQVVSFA
jgi:hypothetical protein